jgi:glutamyl-tRNA reductase
MVIGLNHHTAPAAMRQRFWISEDRRREVMRELLRAEGIEEIIVLTTSDRTEFLLWADNASFAANSVLRLLTAEYGLKIDDWEHFYRLLDDAALLYIFRVASNLDSTATGEPQVAEQVESAWRSAQKAGAAGHFLNAVLTKALSAAQRVRNEAPTGDVAGAQRIVAAEVQGFRRKLLAEHLVPTIVALRHRLDELCRQELDSFKRECGPFPKDQDAILLAVASRLTQKIAGSLARELKEVPEKLQQEQMTAAVQRLFHLESPESALAGTGSLPVH